MAEECTCGLSHWQPDSLVQGSHAAEGTGADKPDPRVSDWLDLTSGARQPVTCGRARDREVSWAGMTVFGPIA